MELVRYIHLNPLRAGLVSTSAQLERFEFCGHAVVLGKRKNDWQVIDVVLRHFGSRVHAARREYGKFVMEGIAAGKKR